MEINTKYKEVLIYVHDNGYTMYLKDWTGEGPKKQGVKIAKTLDEIKKILGENLISLKD